MTGSLKQDPNVKVAIVEDAADTRRGLVKLLHTHPRIKCVAVCESAEVAIELIPECRPQVILMDINLPGMSGIRCTALLKQLLPKTHILMLTAFSDDGSIFEAVQAGASGYLLKSMPSTEIVGSILDVVDGGAPMTGKIARRVLEVFRQTAPPGPAEAQLTTREYEILQLLARGFANKEIAVQLACGVATVKTHLEHIYEKLHVCGRVEATAKYLGGATMATPQVAATRV